MNRDEFLKRFSSQKTARKYLVIFRKFDSFLEERKQSEEEFIASLQQAQRHDKYNLLQELTFYLQRDLSPRSTRNYFDSIFKYLLWLGCELDHTQRRIRVQFPRVHYKIPEGLDRTRIMALLSVSDILMGLFIRVLCGAGLREDEAAQLKPKYFEFEESAEDLPTKIKIVPEIAKFNIGRETFLPFKTAQELKNYIRNNQIDQDQYIFVKEYTKDTVSSFDHEFARIRKRAGLETQGRIKHQHNDLKLHSCRAFFITTWDQLGLKSFGHALAGHSKDRSVYYRMSTEERIKTFMKYQSNFEF